MLARKSRATITLHETSSAMTICVDRGADAHIARAFLHDDAEDYALLDAELGALEHGVPNAADVLNRVTGLEHLGLVQVEDLLERLPLFRARKAGGGAGVPLKRHP